MLLIIAIILLVIAIAGGAIIHPILFALAIVAPGSSGAASGRRTMSRCSTPDRASCSATIPPIAPVAPVTAMAGCIDFPQT